VLWPEAGADLLREKSTAGWLVAAGWCWFGMRENTVGWIQRTE